MLVIGPHSVSQKIIDQWNADEVASWKYFRYAAILPMLIILFEVYGQIQKPWKPVQFWVIVGPQVVLMIGVLFLKPFKTLTSLSLTYTCTERSIRFETIQNESKPLTFEVDWSDIVIAEDLGTKIQLHLKNGRGATLLKECFRDQEQLSEFLQHIPELPKPHLLHADQT